MLRNTLTPIVSILECIVCRQYEGLVGFTLALYVDGDKSVIEYWHQQFTDIEENGVTCLQMV